MRVGTLLLFVLLGTAGCSLFLGGGGIAFDDAGSLVIVGPDGGPDAGRLGPSSDDDGVQPDGGDNPSYDSGHPDDPQPAGRCRFSDAGCADAALLARPGRRRCATSGRPGTHTQPHMHAHWICGSCSKQNFVVDKHQSAHRLRTKRDGRLTNH